MAPRSKNATAPAVALPAATPEADAAVDRYLAAFVLGLANRLANGASNHYRTHFGFGMSEWRAMMAIGSARECIVREVAALADLDLGAASKSVRVLQERGLVSVEQTSRRGRAAIVRLTPEGVVTYDKLRASARRRQQRLLAAFTKDEVELMWSLLRRLKAQVPHMNVE